MRECEHFYFCAHTGVVGVVLPNESSVSIELIHFFTEGAQIIGPYICKPYHAHVHAQLSLALGEG
jgi:hypothetical protein